MLNKFDGLQHHTILRIIDSLPFTSAKHVKYADLRLHGDGQVEYHAKRCPLVTTLLNCTGTCRHYKWTMGNFKKIQA